MHLQDKELTGSAIPDEALRTNKDLKVGDPKSRGMNNEEKKADKARKEGKTGSEAYASKQGETSHGEFHAGDSKSRGMNNAEKKADKAAREGNVDEPSSNQSSAKKSNPSPSKAPEPSKKEETSHGDFKSGDPSSRGMNNAEKRADKAAREGKVQHRDEPSQNSSSKTSPSKGPSPSKSASKSVQPPSEDLKHHGSFQAGDPDSRGMNNEEKKADSARRAGKSGDQTNPNKQAETSHGTYYAGNPNSRGMNNEEKKADKARREGRLPPDQGPGRANDNKSVMGSIEKGTPAQEGAPTLPQREKSEMSTGPGGAGQGEGMTPDVKGGGYERYGSYDDEEDRGAIVSDGEEIKEGTADPGNQVDRYGDEEPALGKERETTLESEADVAISGQAEEEEAFGDEDKKNASRDGLEEAKKATRPEKPARQSSRIKQTGTKRKMREGRESEGLLVSEDEERVKKASKKSVGPGIAAQA